MVKLFNLFTLDLNDLRIKDIANQEISLTDNFYCIFLINDQIPLETIEIDLQLTDRHTIIIIIIIIS